MRQSDRYMVGFFFGAAAAQDNLLESIIFGLTGGLAFMLVGWMNAESASPGRARNATEKE